MTARAAIPVIAVAVGVLATCLGIAPLFCNSALAQTGSGNGISAWFNRDGSAGSAQTVPAPASANHNVGPLDKFSARIKKTFKRTSQNSQNSASAKTTTRSDNDAVSLSTPAKPRADFYISLARMQERSGNPTTAAEQYKRALQLEPDNLAALMALARLYDRQGQLTDALKYYKQAAAAHPKEAAVFNDQGLCYARQEQYAEAVGCLRKAVELRPQRVLYRNNLATVQIEVGQIDQAFQTLSAVHSAAVARYNIGFLLNKRGETAQALEQFKLAAASDASFEAAGQWVETLSAKLAAERAPALAGGTPAAGRQSGRPAANPVMKRDVDPTLGLSGAAPRPPMIKAAEQPPAASTATASDPAPDAPTLASPSPILSPPTTTPSPALPSLPAAMADNGAAGGAAGQTAAKVPDALPPSTLAVRDLPAESVAPPAARPVKPSPPPSTSAPGPILQLAPQRGPGIVRPRTDQNDQNSQPPNREAQRGQPTAVVAERPRRLPPMRLPPTPDEIQDYSRNRPAVDPNSAIVPLPPVDPGHYPASRY